MKSLNLKLKRFSDALNGIGFDEIYHYDAGTSNSKRYIVWTEEGEGTSEYSNNRHANQVIQGSVDLYTTEEFDVLVDAIQDAMDADYIAFTLMAVQYETETGFIHYTWKWEIS